MKPFQLLLLFLIIFPIASAIRCGEVCYEGDDAPDDDYAPCVPHCGCKCGRCYCHHGHCKCEKGHT